MERADLVRQLDEMLDSQEHTEEAYDTALAALDQFDNGEIALSSLAQVIPIKRAVINRHREE